MDGQCEKYGSKEVERRTSSGSGAGQKQMETSSIRYDRIDDLHWKTDRQAVSLI